MASANDPMIRSLSYSGKTTNNHGLLVDIYWLNLQNTIQENSSVALSGSYRLTTIRNNMVQGGVGLDYHHYFDSLKDSFSQGFDLPGVEQKLTTVRLVIGSSRSGRPAANDQYRSKSANVPAYYNPNTHAVYLNRTLLDKASPKIVHNICYHELLHAVSHHASINYQGRRILKSGLKIQMWDDENRQRVIHRGLNEGLTQYLANSHTDGGPAYREEVRIVGRLTQLIGLQPLNAAYFGPSIDRLERQLSAKLGVNSLNDLSELIDKKNYSAAMAYMD